MNVGVSLRARLLAGMVVLVAAGLAAAAVVTYEEQRSFLLNRVDQQVRSAFVPLAFALRVDRPRPTGTAGGAAPRSAPGRFPSQGATRGPGFDLPPGTFGEIVGSGGTVLRRRTFSYGQTGSPPPRLPANPPISRRGGPLRVFTVAAPAAGMRYRAAAFDVSGDTAVVAVPLRETDATLHRLVVVELLVGGAVIVALIALGWFVIRLGLRPLERIGRVASEIASGDLSRRVTPADGRSEVGRLGRSLNEMLGQIEDAFQDRSRSEARLRRFLADASHELRTPLAAIRGYAELFRIGAASEPETLARALSRIEAEAQRMGVLVEDLLVLAQLDHVPEPRRLPVDLHALARSAVDDARVLDGERPITLHDASPEPLVISGDPDRLRQVLANLLRNALIHTPAGSPVEVSVARHEAGVALRVRDHGPGLPADDPEQLFERFWRQEGGRRRGPGGAGLGLPIARAIVEAHGGTVTAGDAAGGGAEFTVTLPLGTEAGWPEDDDATPRKSSGSSRRPLMHVAESPRS